MVCHERQRRIPLGQKDRHVAALHRGRRSARQRREQHRVLTRRQGLVLALWRYKLRAPPATAADEATWWSSQTELSDGGVYNVTTTSADGKVWFSGQRYFDPATQSWADTVYQDFANAIAVDSSGGLWVATEDRCHLHTRSRYQPARSVAALHHGQRTGRQQYPQPGHRRRRCGSGLAPTKRPSPAVNLGSKQVH